MDYAVLTIGLRRTEAGACEVVIDYSNPASATDMPSVLAETAFNDAGLKQLRDLALDIEESAGEYAQAITGALFYHDASKDAFKRARDDAKASYDKGLRLRVRISVHENARELHDLYWELLLDPLTGTLIATDQNVLFSRYLTGDVWLPVPPKERDALKAMVVVASPSDISTYQPGGMVLSPLKIDDELARSRAALGPIATTVTLASSKDPNNSPDYDPPTLNNIFSALGEGCDILYLVCHGDRIGAEPHIYLEDDEPGNEGKTRQVSTGEFVRRLRDLQKLPRLIALVSCESASAGGDPMAADSGVLSALGPSLASAGIPAVVAMQGSISISTMSVFIPSFFKELRRDGQLDRAMAAARGAVRDRKDNWMPVLFMQLRAGSLWDGTGFTDSFNKWPSLLARIDKGTCTPILGFGLNESTLGSKIEIAADWATWLEQFGYSIEPCDRRSLPEVAQALAAQQSDFDYPRSRLEEYIHKRLTARFGSQVPLEDQNGTLSQLIAAVGKLSRRTNPADPHKVLAEAPFPIYVTTSPDSLMTEALVEAGKKPRVLLCPWKESLWAANGSRRPSPLYIGERGYAPSRGEPLVYHYFGNLDQPKSMVITKDDYFDYLIGVTQNNDLVDSYVKIALASTALLFLGFRIDDFDFRALFRIIVNVQGRDTGISHVAVQIDPGGSQGLEMKAIQLYLKRYFGGADVTIYWGTVEDFVAEFQVRWQRYQQEKRGNQ